MPLPFKPLRNKRGYYTLSAPVSADDIIKMAIMIIQRRFRRGKLITSPLATKEFLQLKLAGLEYEAFCIMYLDNSHRLITFEKLFNGTIDGASVYPREIVKRALQYNAAAVIFAHNHPSGNVEPSQADRALTTRLKNALELIDVRTLDHLIVTANGIVSLAERGMM